jgi:hypothetical protein
LFYIILNVKYAFDIATISLKISCKYTEKLPIKAFSITTKHKQYKKEQKRSLKQNISGFKIYY